MKSLISMCGRAMVLAFGCMAVTSTTALAVNLIVDGDFETPALSAPGYLVVTTGNSVGAWLVGNDASYGTGDNVTLERFPALPQFNPWLTAHGGLQYLDLPGVANQPGSLVEQVVPTIPGQWYVLDYWAGSANSVNHTFPIKVTALVIDHTSSVLLLADDFTTTATPAVNEVIWEHHVLVPVQATSTQTRIRFRNSFSSQDACLLDDIGFEALGPTPAVESSWAEVKAHYRH